MNGNPDNETIELIERLARAIAKDKRDRLGSWVPVDDLVSRGILEGFEAWARYDPTRGASFVTYTFSCIAGAMKDELTRLTRETKMVNVKMYSIDRHFPPDPDNPDATWGTLQIPVDDNAIDEIDNRDEVEVALSCLDEIERRVIEWIYFGDKTLVDIGRILGVGKSTVSRIKLKALDKMKQHLKGDD